MMPDNKGESDTAGQEAANDVANEPVDADTNAVDGSDAQDQSTIDAVVENIEAQSAETEEGHDPMGFGDQRIGDEGEEPQDELSQLQAQVQEAESKSAEYWDRLLRLQAEMENQRKRAQNDVNKARKFALEGIVDDLLPVKDSLEMGLAAAAAEDADPASLVTGAELTLKMLAQVFEKNNILEVNPLDEKFNPEFHQAMSMQEVEGREPNTITSVMQKGYTLNDRLVRPALVMVSK